MSLSDENESLSICYVTLQLHNIMECPDTIKLGKPEEICEFFGLNVGI